LKNLEENFCKESCRKQLSLVAVVVRVGEHFWRVCKPIVNRRYFQLVGKFCSGFVYLRERAREREREELRDEQTSCDGLSGASLNNIKRGFILELLTGEISSCFEVYYAAWVPPRHLGYHCRNFAVCGWLYRIIKRYMCYRRLS